MFQIFLRAFWVTKSVEIYLIRLWSLFSSGSDPDQVFLRNSEPMLGFGNILSDVQQFPVLLVCAFICVFPDTKLNERITLKNDIFLFFFFFFSTLQYTITGELQNSVNLILLFYIDRVKMIWGVKYIIRQNIMCTQ